MKTTDFAECLTGFLSMYLPGRNISENTIKSYRDTFMLVLVFSEEKCRISSEKLTLAKFNHSFVDQFLNLLDKNMKNSISSRHQSLGAIPSFIK